MKPYYQDVCERVFLARSAICSSKSGYRVDFENDNKNMKLIEKLVNDVIAACNKKNDDININLLRFKIDHAVNHIIDYLKRNNCVGYPTFIDFLDYAWGEIRNNIDIAFLASVRDKEIVYKINLPYKSQEKVIWHRWFNISINKNFDPEEIICVNTGSDQDNTKVSQHLDISRLIINYNRIQLCFTDKRETPEAYNNNNVMSVDKGSNNFLVYHFESFDGVSIHIDHCINNVISQIA